MTLKTFSLTTVFVLATASFASAQTAGSTNETLDYQLPPLVVAAPAAPVPDAAASYTPAEAAIDRTKFTKVYLAGKAVEAAQYLSAVGVSPRQFEQLLLTFSTELAIMADLTTTKAEISLSAKYQIAYLQFSTGLAELPNYAAHYGLDTMTKASNTLDAANKIYLRRPEAR